MRWSLILNAPEVGVARFFDIAERVWYAPRAHGHEFFLGTDNQLIRAFKSGPLQWPSGEDGA